MDGIHDLGGKPGHGQVVVEKHEPVFHSRWEAAVFAMAAAGSAAGAWTNTDRFRHAIERIDPVAYLTQGYYGRWLGGIENLLVEAGIVTREMINARVQKIGGSLQDLVASRPELVPDPMSEAGATPGSSRTVNRKPRFATGDLVRTSAQAVPGHTRLPAYARDKVGTILTMHEAWVYPDSNAHGLGEDPQYLYTVQFTGIELWGKGDENIKVSLDLFEPYLSEVS
ncbi:MAG: nitrile hydratase subunit beta [Proteobacteria bacterium]|nr:nitrile hydratase subunit beta [Pseudomonadota bacterium]